LLESSSMIKSPTDLQDITDRKLDLIVDKEIMGKQLKQMQKKEAVFKQKINKMLFLFFTLQNKGIPVNEIYEAEGIKQIMTERFDEIMT